MYDRWEGVEDDLSPWISGSCIGHGYQEIYNLHTVCVLGAGGGVLVRKPMPMQYVHVGQTVLHVHVHVTCIKNINAVCV